MNPEGVAPAAAETNVTSLRIGAVVASRWRLDEVLGIGGAAAVYAATNLQGRRAAIKILHPVHRNNADVQDRFLFEFLVTNSIRHRGVPRAFETLQLEDGAYAIVMELLEGETLQTRLAREGQLSIAETLPLVEQILDFLVVFHAAGFIHRDLKPSNVFLGTDGVVRVLDFGVTRHRARRYTRKRLAIGTPSNMSPEQALGLLQDHDERTDVFGVGALIYELLSGRPVRGGSTVEDQMRNAASSVPASIALVLPGLPEDVAYLVDRAIAWERNHRWPTAEHVRAEVRALIDRYRDDALALRPTERRLRADRAQSPALHGSEHPTLRFADVRSAARSK